jgi:type II secretory pathway pseudopilin PulG
LLEIVVVLGLVAALACVFLGGFGGGKAVALLSAQSVVANLLAAARARAAANGQTTRVLVNLGSSDPAGARRYLRVLVLQEQTTDGGWQMVTSASLPDGAAVVPARSLTPAGLLADPDRWRKSDGGVLESSALAELAGPAAVAAFPGDSWGAIAFTPSGTPEPAGGCLALALARTMPPGHTPPVQLCNPQDVRGVRLSRYGVPVMLNGPDEF